MFGGFFGTNFGLGVRSFWGGFLGLRCPRPENGNDKVLPFLGFFRSSIFVTARFCGGFWAVSSVSCIGCVFRWFRVCVFVWIYLSDSGSSLFLPFSGLRGRGFGVHFPSSLLFLLLLPPLFLGVGLGSLSFLLCVSRQDPRGRPRQVRPAPCGMPCLSSFPLFSLCPGRPLSPSPFFLSFFLIFFLACVIETER